MQDMIEGSGAPKPLKTGPNAAQRSEELQDAVGGRTAALQLGEDVVQFTPQRPTESTRQLWSYLTTCVCASIGIPKVVAFSEWQEKYQGTVVRGDYDIAAQFFRARSAVFAAAFREVYLYVIGWGIRTEASLADKPGDGSWTNVTVRPPRAVNVDVGHNSAAEKGELADGRTNYDLIYGPRGLDWKEEITKLAKQVSFMKKLAVQEGIEFTDLREQAQLSQPAPAPAAAPEEVTV